MPAESLQQKQWRATGEAPLDRNWLRPMPSSHVAESPAFTDRWTTESRRGLFGGQWEDNAHGRAMSGARLKLELSVMRFDDTLDDGQAQARAFAFG